jgi:hypothetical protein
MAFSISPAVTITEQDLTNVVNQVSTTPGAFVGDFEWGPVMEVTTVTDSNVLVNRFGKPNDTNFVSFFSASNFLDYTNNIQLIRVTGSLAKNATADGTGLKIDNRTIWTENYSAGEGAVGDFAAKYPGSKGNGLIVEMADSATFAGVALPGTITVALGSTSVTGVATSFLADLHVGATLKNSLGATIGNVKSIISDTALTLQSGAAVAVTAAAATFDWAYAPYFGIAPGTSSYVANKGGSNDEVHIIVIDGLGKFTGAPGSVLKAYPFASKAIDAFDASGNSTYYANVLINDQYVWWMDHPTGTTNWGTPSAGKHFDSLAFPVISNLTGGVDAVPVDGEKLTGWLLLQNTETYDVSLLITGDASQTLATAIINDVAEVRKDCVAFISPLRTDVINNTGNEAVDTITFANSLTHSTYAFMTCNWKYQYDRFNDVYRWVPDNADIAGLCARTDSNFAPWFSPAGDNRGSIKNVTKMAWTPSKADRDILYINSINPVLTFPRRGTLLYGDKTFTNRPGAFSRINVRRLFIVLEKSIATAAQYQMFEFNDVFSQANFRNLVNPFLREVQGGRGIQGFSVICDSSNNTPQIVAANQFKGQIVIQPNYSINAIELTFVATNNVATFNVIGG